MINLNFPDTPPVWLAQWLTDADVDALFPRGLRSTAFSQYARLPQANLMWGEKTYRASMGAQMVTWRLDNGKWSSQCHCGAPSPCIHALLAHVLLKQACRMKEWKMPVKSVPPAAPRPPAAGTGVAAPHRAVFPEPIAAPGHFHSPGIRGQNGRDNGTLPLFGDATASFVQSKGKLEVQTSFHEDNGKLAVMFDLEIDGRHEIAHLARMRNLGHEIITETPERPARIQWQQSDRDFLRWLYPILQKMEYRTLSERRSLPLSMDDFRAWLKRWQNVPGRFIDRDSRTPLDQCIARVPQRLAFALYDHGEAIHVGALFYFADGQRLHYHQLQELIQQDPSHFLVKVQIESFACPVSWELLKSYFSHHVCVLSRNEVCQRLPVILGGRLDLIEPGPCVKLVKSPDRLRLEGGVNDMGDFTVALKIGGNVIPVQSAQGVPASIRREGWRFVITTHSSEGVAELATQVKGLMTTCQAHAGNGILAFDGTPDNARRLRSFWMRVPNTIEKRAERPLAGLLSEQAVPVSLSWTLHELNAFVELAANYRCAGQGIKLDELKRVSSANTPYLRTSEGGWLYIDQESVARAMDALDNEGFDGRPTLMLRTEARDAVKRIQDSHALNWEDRSVSLVQRLQQESFPPPPALPGTLDGVLRPYQKTGVQFLADCCRYGVGAILADDMGLGKTLQVLAMLDSFFKQSPEDFRALVICPASVIDTWVQQCQRFTPELPVAALRGTPEKRMEMIADSRNRLLVTHYALVRVDIESLLKSHFQYVILDEAQAIKNPEAQTTAAVRALPTEHRLALTGTPLENRLGDLWSILDFLNPGLCGDKVSFEVSSSMGAGLTRLRRILSLVMLRRSKSVVAPELPPRTEETIRVEMSPELRILYEREMMRARNEGMAGGYPGILAAITRMRRFCCAPELLLTGENIPASPKVDFLLERLADLTAAGHSVLVFSQFTSLLDYIALRLDAAKIRYATITGQTPLPKRSQIVDEFNGSAEPTVLLLSLKAAGTGLTLTKADYVFLFDPWWNPAAENQAIDRTHRIGQDKPVFAYRIIVQNSIEEKVLAIVQHKRELFSTVIDGAGADGDQPRLSLDELRSLL